MSLPWVKVHTTLLDNDRYRALSAAAKHTFTTAIILAGKLDVGEGRLEIERVGPMSAAAICGYTSLRIKCQEDAIAELLQVGFFERDLTGTLRIARFEEKAGDDSRRASNAERQRRHRSRRNGVTGVTNNALPSNEIVTDKEAEEEVDNSSSLRSDAPNQNGKAEPEWVTALREAARPLRLRTISSFGPEDRSIAARYHCLEFGNCTKSEGKNRDRASGVAGAFASMGRNKHYGDITFGEYVGFARTVHKNREKKPWFDIWDIRGVVEFDGAA